MRRAVGGIVVVSILGCGGSFDPAGVARVLDAVESTGEPEMAVKLLIAGGVEPESGMVSSRCAEAWKDVGAADPEQRSHVITMGLVGYFPACSNPCSAEAFRTFAEVASEERMVYLRENCAPDPLFGDPALAPLYDRLDVTDWIVVYAVTDSVMAAGGPEAARLTALAPRLAIGMIAYPEVPWDDSEQPAAGSLSVQALPADLAVTDLVTPYADALRACLPEGRASGTVRVVLGTDGKVARLLASSAAGPLDCWDAVLRPLAWPSSGVAVIDVQVAR